MPTVVGGVRGVGGAVVLGAQVGAAFAAACPFPVVLVLLPACHVVAAAAHSKCPGVKFVAGVQV